MGTSYSARALIGCRFSEQDLFKTRKVNRFAHSYPAEMNYCPKTGQPLWIEQKVCILDETLDDFSSVSPILQGGIYCFYDGSARGERPFLIGVHAVEDRGESWRRQLGQNFCPLDDSSVAEARKLCQKVLEPHGLWKPERFGLHVMLCELLACFTILPS